MRFRHGNRKIIKGIALVGMLLSFLVSISTGSNILEHRILSETAHAVLILVTIGVVASLLIANAAFSGEIERLNRDGKHL